MTSPSNKLICVLGPTAVGKTAYAVALATKLHTEIVSCDSRQFYEELNIGVARPTPTELAAVPHHFIACRSVRNPFNVFTYQEEAIRRLETLFQSHDTVVAVGGSGLYIDALCKGIAILPDPAPELRARLKQQLADEGILSFQQQLRQLDPIYYEQVDHKNPIRLQRALEVCLTTGRPYSEVIRQELPRRDFAIEKVVLAATPERLRERINRRVDEMMTQGLDEEARQLLPLRHLTPLNTVGYKEFFSAWDLGNNRLEDIAADIKTHTWQYAKKQITWLKRNSATDSKNQETIFRQPPDLL